MANSATMAQDRLSSGYRLSHAPPGEEVVITGISGNFPDSDNVSQLKDNLFNKVDLISSDDRRWKLAHPEIPQRTGKINNVNKFDASFFGVHYKQAHTMDPMCRILLEKAYEAVIDSGTNPKQLKNSKTGVFIGACFSESEKTWFYEKMQVNGFGITGCSRAMLANRISYWLGTTGPSYTVDSACSSSLYAMEHAFRSIRDGHCDAAIVGGSNLCLHPYVSLQFSRLGVLSQGGRCRSFDKDADGYARSEAIAVCFLQKAKDSRRVYAQVLHAKTNCDGYKEKGITYPAGHIQKLLLSEFYEECRISPQDLEFVEAHGTGTRVGDPEELIAIDEIFCTGRSGSLDIGSVKSNLGHSEPASGLCSIAKMCIAYDTGFIPPNLHFNEPRGDVPALLDGRLRVVTEKTPWGRGMAGVNSFGFGGANAHVLLSNYAKPKVNEGLPTDDLPRLICVSGRLESAVERLLDDAESKPVDVEHVRLLQAIHEEDISGHVVRGFTLLASKPPGSVRLSRDVQYFPGTRRPVWFVFSGMGSQWPGMGEQLMRIPIFAAAIHRCHKVLETKGIDLTTVITSSDPTTFDNILNSFVGIAAIQIGLCDILKAIGIEPDYIIGHSVGELGCAYADGGFTAEQMILAAYSRGLASIQTPFIKGSMAAIGIGYQQMKELCPPDIEVACRNSAGSCTISGPADSMAAFVAKLTGQGIFAKEVPCANIAFHSRYIAEAGPTLLKYLQEVVPDPKPRSAKWLSTSVPQAQWKDKKAEFNSAEYHTNNLLNPVLFEETCRLVPANAITIEIAPHGLLQAILRHSMKPECTNVALAKRGHADNVEVLFTAIGKLYEVGLNPIMANIYPKVDFPVSTGTPMLSHLVEWEHSEDWYVTSYRAQEKMKSGERTVRMSIADEDCEFLIGHVVDGRNLYPATGYLVLVWETLGMMMGELYTEVSVVFENVSFKRATNIPTDGTLEFIVMIQKGSGNFELVESGAAIVTGKIYAQNNVSQNFRILPDPPSETPVTTLVTKDIYKELKLRGYHYSGVFRSLVSSNIEGNHAFIAWNNNWVSFMDTMLQMKILSNDTRSLFVPTRIERLSIDVTAHYKAISGMSPNLSEQIFEVKSYSDVDVIRGSGVEIRGLHASPISRRNPLGIPLLEKYQFVPNLRPERGDIDDILKCDVLMVLENVQTAKVKVLELADEDFKAQNVEIVAEKIADILADVPLIHAEVVVVSETPMDANPKYTVESRKLAQETNTLIFVGTNLLKRPDELKLAIGTLRDKGFLISRETEFPDIAKYADRLHILTVANTGEEFLVLMRKRVGSKPAKFVHVQTSDLTFPWVEKVKEEMKDSGKVVLISENEPLNGLLGLVNCLRREPGGEIVYGLMISDPDAPPFNPDSPFYEDHLDKDLALNVLEDGQWGTYRHLSLGDVSRVRAEHAFVNVGVFGDLSSLCWFEGPLKINKRILKKERQLFHIYYSALNFRDIMTATGRISVDAVARGRLNQVCVQGLEFCGRTVEGRRMMGMVSSSALSNMVEADDFMLWPVPDAWSLAEACTVPVAYGTVYYAMIMVGAMQKGETVLIHAGSGGVGQAAIHVCLHHGCNVFTTVGTSEKRAFIKKMFPQLKDSQIGNSRDTSFEEMVLRETGGKGVDIVLNSLAEEKLQASIRCLGYKGRFLEIGKFDITNNTAVGMSFFLKEASFHGIMMDFLFEQTCDARKKLQQMLHDGIMSGAVKPLVSIQFEKHEVEKAFRYMAAGKHIGKVIIKIREEEKDRIVKPSYYPIEALPRYICHGDDSYVIVGGLGGFGLELADWLVLRGARKLVINSRRGVSNGYQASRLRVWRSYGAVVEISTDDVTTEEGCVSLLEKATELGIVRGIFNLAVVLKDGLFINQTPETFATSFGPKAIATKHLDHVSRRMCPQLQDFVIFSSVSCGRGNAGQTNYGMANGVMERICEWRRKLRLPALAVQWGAVGEVGLVADMQQENHELEIAGTLQQRVGSCLDVLDQFLRQTDAPVVACMVVAEKRVGGLGCGGMVETIANIMGIKDLKKVSQQVSLAELGMDSIMAVEIQQCLEREFEIFLTAQDIRTLTFGRLNELSQTREDEASPQAVNKVIDTQVGLKVLLRNFGDPFQASEPIVNMTTMTSDGREGEDVIYNTDKTLFMVPGVEGMASVLETISKRIRSKVCVLQLGYNHFNESIEDIANRLVVPVRTRLEPGTPFTILGYSFGAHVALEMAAILESEGHIGTVFCLDGSPDFLHSFLHLTINVNDEGLLQDYLLCHVLDILSPQGSEVKHLLPILETVETFEHKIDIFLKHLPENDFSRQQSQALATVVYDRIIAVKNYEQKNVKKLKSPIILMRPKETPPNMVVDENYGLDKYSEQVVKVHFLEGTHVSIVENKDCANIINRVLVQNEKLLKQDAVKSGQYAYTGLVKQQAPEQLK